MKKRIADLIQQRLNPDSAVEKPKPEPASTPAPVIEEYRRMWMESAINRSEIEDYVADIREGRLFTFDEIAKMLRCSYDTIRRVFLKERGLIRIRGDYRVPETVLKRVLRQMISPGSGLEK